MNAQTFSLALGEISDKYINEAINYTAAEKPQHTVRRFHFSKRAVAIVAIIAALLTTACSVKAFREAISEFFIGIRDSFYDFYIEQDSCSIIEQQYCFVTYPEGFEEISNEVEETLAVQKLQNAAGDKIILTQTLGDTSLAVDAENTEAEQLDVNGIEVLLYTRNGANVAVWINNSYYFTLTHYGEIDTQSMQELIGMIEIKEN